MKKIEKVSMCWTFVTVLSALLSLVTNLYTQIIISILMLVWGVIAIIHTTDFIRD